MKLGIEKWVEATQPFTEKASELFSEAIADYKIGSYNSAFILSYLAFKLTVRSRILDFNYKGELPKTPIDVWNTKIVEILNNDDKWEAHLNDIVATSCKPLDKRSDIGVLNFSYPTRFANFYEYWRNTRNACTHGKTQTIGSATVESFWYYLMDNLSQFRVLGSEKYLVDSLADAYNRYNYPKVYERSLIDGLLVDIATIFQDSVSDFFERFFVAIKKTYNPIDKTTKGFWDKIIYCPDPRLSDGFIKYLIQDNEVKFFNFYKYFPELLERSISQDSTFVLEILNVWLERYTGIVFDMDQLGSTFWEILSSAIEREPDNVSVEKVVSSKPLSMISYFPGDDHAIKVLNEHHVLREFLLKNAGWYFKSDAYSQWTHNNEFAQYVNYVEKIFSYIEWDDVVMETLDSSIYTFYESFRTRYNQDSITNGERFEDSCRRVLAANISKIKEVPDWESYKNIYKMITGK